MTQVYHTRDDLIQAVLEALKVVAFGQPPGAEEWSLVDEHIDPVLAELAALKIVYVADANAVPSEIFLTLAQVVARHLADNFSIPVDESDKMFTPENNPFSPEAKLRAMFRSSGSYPPQIPDYF